MPKPQPRGEREECRHACRFPAQSRLHQAPMNDAAIEREALAPDAEPLSAGGGTPVVIGRRRYHAHATNSAGALPGDTDA
jgi:hypothetical protein